ncbi:ferredoxin-NADP reductase [Kribbella amoyensis]|uniref:Ferredoxin-NADP reductase n=1 Tax=Kribbella amoyensis TaxID=996641 RepID=A0A561B8K6_9ACTN|nr:ferredoxin-NADP reductase [Kribbella amoyensis]
MGELSGPAESPVVVSALTWEAEGVVAVTLRGTDAAVLPSWSPGAHVDLILPNGARRQYSLCGDPADDRTYRVAVDRVVDTRGGSEYVHLFLRPGQRLRVGVPRNHFALDPSERSWLFLAGGIGITPFLPILGQAEAAGIPWQLHYAGRTRSRMAFADLIAAKPGRATVYETSTGSRPDLPALVAACPPGSGVYVCGPERLLDASEQLVSARPDLTLHAERFRPRTKELPAPRPFTLTTRRSGLTISVPAERSPLQVLESHGVRIPSGCRTGLCGACEIAVLAGEVEHRDDVLTGAQRATGRIMLPCVSRAQGETLVVDV